MPKCPYCGRKLTENEMFCLHCEQDVSKIKEKMERPGSEEGHGH